MRYGSHFLVSITHTFLALWCDGVSTVLSPTLMLLLHNIYRVFVVRLLLETLSREVRPESCSSVWQQPEHVIYTTYRHKTCTFQQIRPRPASGNHSSFDNQNSPPTLYYSRLLSKVNPGPSLEVLSTEQEQASTETLTKHGYMQYAEPKTFGTAWIRLYFSIDNGQLLCREVSTEWGRVGKIVVSVHTFRDTTVLCSSLGTKLW